VKWFKHYYKERGGRRKSHFAEGGNSNSQRCCLCCWCNDVIAIISHHVHRRNDEQNGQSLNLVQCSLHHLAEITMKQKNYMQHEVNTVIHSWQVSEMTDRCLGCEMSLYAGVVVVAEDADSVGCELRWCQIPVFFTSSEMLTSSRWIGWCVANGVASVPMLPSCGLRLSSPMSNTCCIIHTQSHFPYHHSDFSYDKGIQKIALLLQHSRSLLSDSHETHTRKWKIYLKLNMKSCAKYSLSIPFP